MLHIYKQANDAMKASKRIHKTAKTSRPRGAAKASARAAGRAKAKRPAIGKKSFAKTMKRPHPQVKRKTADESAHEEAARAKKADASKKAVMGLPDSSESKSAIDILMQNAKGISYLKKNVSKNVVDVISLLTAPRTDEYITEKLGIKINAVRRMLNIMQNYGITNYYISKNKNGWLSFAWYMNTGKLPAFLEMVKGAESEKSMIEEDCNDYFVCNSCYKENKLIFTFDAAYEAGFACNACGKNLDRVGNKTDVESLLGAGSEETKELR
jgi:transcription factor E